jgi:hypothetical protein
MSAPATPVVGAVLAIEVELESVAKTGTAVTGTVYIGHTAVEQVEAALAEFDAHVPGGADGQCLTCRDRPCPGQAPALRTLAQYGRLPRRRPGATRPERIGLRRVPGTGSVWATAESEPP